MHLLPHAGNYIMYTSDFYPDTANSLVKIPAGIYVCTQYYNIIANLL